MTHDFVGWTRRYLLQATGAGASGFALAGLASAAEPASAPPSTVDRGRVENGKVVFDEWRGAADEPSAPAPAPLPPEQRVGFAVVGLGRLALGEILPAFGACKNARLAALVSGSPDKLKAVARQYGVPPSACYDYESFDRIADQEDVGVVYVALPNGLHRAYVERAAAAAKHVLCEKPMATNAQDAEAMIAACRNAGRKLMIAYRIQYEPYNLRAMRFVREKTFGRLVAVNAVNVQTVAANGAAQWRHKRAMSGGGALPDIGLYCLNTARFLTGEEPVEIFATQYSPPGDPRYADVEETISFMLRFPSNAIASCLTSYGARDDKHQRLNFESATLDMPDAYMYRGQRMSVIQRQGDVAAEAWLKIAPQNQFAAEMDHMADCVIHDRTPRTPGEEGAQDHRLMEAIYESAGTGKPIALAPAARLDAFRGSPLKGAN